MRYVGCCDICVGHCILCGGCKGTTWAITSSMEAIEAYVGGAAGAAWAIIAHAHDAKGTSWAVTGDA